MGFAHNNVLHANHFRKDWQRRVRTWFDQPGRKLRRRTARKTKAATLGVRPIEPLRPAVRAQTVRYNRKVREGRGFTLAELKEAGVGRKEARGVGIVVDHRRRNLSEEGKKINVERLLAYKSKLIVFPRKAGKPKKGDSTGDDLTAATTRAAIPLPDAYPAEAPRKITAEERDFKAYRTLRDARADQRHAGVRKARQAKVGFLTCFRFRVRLTFPPERRGGGKQEEGVSLPAPALSFSS
ncbi:60S ribosomal protein L13 [Mycena filopes]|nr:60S ribosomal protein L13 [Mycena filopes]